jgi:hypothetical protein
MLRGVTIWTAEGLSQSNLVQLIHGPAAAGVSLSIVSRAPVFIDPFIGDPFIGV